MILGGPAALLLIAATAGPAGEGEVSAEAASSPQSRLETVEVTGKAVRDPAWTSYRQTYKAMQMFADAKDSTHLEPRLQLVPLVSNPPKSADLRLTISSAELDIGLPLDHGWSTLPMNQAALESDAEFLLNVPAGTFQLRRVMAIRRNPEGQYPTEALRKGCNAWLNAMRSLNLVYRVKYAFSTCTGVKWVASENDLAQIHSEDGSPLPLSREPDAVPQREYRVLAYRFPAGGAEPVVKAPPSVVAILPLLD